MLEKCLAISINGAPGCGKRTQGELLDQVIKKRNLNLPRFEMSQELATWASLAHEVSAHIAREMKNHGLVNDAATMACFGKKVEALSTSFLEGYVVDGFPRTRRQYQSFKEYAHFHHYRRIIIIDINLHMGDEVNEGADAELINRLVNREGRKISAEEAAKRVGIFKSHTLPFLELARRESDVGGIESGWIHYLTVNGRLNRSLVHEDLISQLAAIEPELFGLPAKVA